MRLGLSLTAALENLEQGLGAVKGNFSRLTRGGGPAEFSQVLLQQGRVLLDSDWNDLVALFENKLRRRTQMLVGEAGAPFGSDGFGLNFKGGIELNTGGPADGQYDQAVTLRRRASLPFRETGLDQPYSLRLDFLLPAEGCCRDAPRAVLIGVPGRWSVQVEPDRCLLVYGPHEHSGPWTRLGPVAADRLQHLHVSWDGHALLAFWTSTSANAAPERYEELDLGSRDDATVVPSRTAVIIGGSPRGDAYLRCTFAGLSVWDARLEPGIDPTSLRTEESRCRLVCLLDTSNVTPKRDPPGALVADTSGSHNDASIRLEQSEQRLPPVRLVQAEIGAGSYFIAGLEVRNPTSVAFHRQPWGPARLPGGGHFAGVAHLFYLEAWERFVSALQYPELLEPALGGPDTTARTELVWQVRAITAPSLEEARRRFDAHTHRNREPALARFHRPEHASGRAGNQLYRVEVHHPGWARGDIHERNSTPVAVERVTTGTVAILEPEFAELLRPEAPVALGNGELEPFVTHVVAAHGGGRFDLARLPSRLPHDLRLQPLATFKWSRENGAVAFRVRRVRPADTRTADGKPAAWIFTLENTGYNGFDLRAGDYLELVDDTEEVARRGGTFFRLTAVDDTELELTAATSSALEHVELGRGAVLRRWNGHDARDFAPAPLRLVAGSQLLEQNIHVEFEGRGFYAGAAWWVVPVRDDVGDGLLWPGERYLPPQGVELHSAPLASLELGQGLARACDLRTRFGSLSELSQEGRTPCRSERPAGSSPPDPLHAGGAAYLMAEGTAALSGFERTGVRVEGRSLRAESWQLVQASESPRGPGVGLVWLQRPVFVGATSARLDERGAWRPLAPLDRRVDFAACASGSRLFVFGGRDATMRDQRLLASTRLLEENATAWRDVAEFVLPEPICSFAAVEREGKFHLVGGLSADGVQKTHRIFDPKTGKFSLAADMPTARKNLAVVLHDGLLYAFGGCDAKDAYLAIVECWDPFSDTWRTVAPLDEGTGPGATADLAVVSVREGIVVVGGFDGTAKSETWLFLPALRRWQALAPLAVPRARHGLIGTEDWREPGRPHVYAVGGSDGRRDVAQVEALALVRTFEIMRPIQR